MKVCKSCRLFVPTPLDQEFLRVQVEGRRSRYFVDDREVCGCRLLSDDRPAAGIKRITPGLDYYDRLA